MVQFSCGYLCDSFFFIHHTHIVVWYLGCLLKKSDASIHPPNQKIQNAKFSTF